MVGARSSLTTRLTSYYYLFLHTSSQKAAADFKNDIMLVLLSVPDLIHIQR